MGNLWLKIKIWSKVSIVGAILIYVLIFTAKNSTEPVKFWFWFNKTADTSILLFALYAVLTGIVFTVLVGTTFRTIRQVRELRNKSRTDRLERDMADMRAKAAMLRPKPPACRAPTRRRRSFRPLLDVCAISFSIPPGMKGLIMGRSWITSGTIALLSLAAVGCQNKVMDENRDLHRQNVELQAQLDERGAPVRLSLRRRP